MPLSKISINYLIFCALFLCGIGLLIVSLSSDDPEDERFLLLPFGFCVPLAVVRFFALFRAGRLLRYILYNYMSVQFKATWKGNEYTPGDCKSFMHCA